jgi:hypothetical protein
MGPIFVDARTSRTVCDALAWTLFRPKKWADLWYRIFAKSLGDDMHCVSVLTRRLATPQVQLLQT